MTVMFRPMTPADYEALARFYVRAGEPTTAGTLRYNDETRETYCKYGRLLAEVNGAVVGTARYKQNAGAYHSQKFDVKVLVLPEYRGRGIGTALYEGLMQHLAPFHPIALMAAAQEDEPAGIRFAARRGFVEDQRQWEYRLDLTRPEVNGLDEALARAATAGYEIVTLAELMGDPSQFRRVYELLNEVRRDIPTAEERTDIPWERWAKAPSNPHFWPEGYIIARKGTELVGLSQLWRSDEPGKLQNGITAVRRTHRGFGVAQAMKVHGMRTARATWYQQISTWNATTNQGMMAINEKLGFVRQPASIHYTRQM